MTRRLTPGFVVMTVTIACLSAVSLDGQAPNADDLSPKNLDAWLGAIQSHLPGELDAAAETVAPSSQADLDGLFTGLQKQFKFFVEGRAPVAFSAIFRRYGVLDEAAMNRTLKLGAFLHADVAVLHRTQNGYTLPSDNRSIKILNDGRQIGVAGGTVHWGFARRLLDHVRPRPAADEYVRLWYRATAAFFEHWNDYVEAPPLLREARALFPGDAVLIMYDGALHEAYADPRVQRVALPSALPSRLTGNQIEAEANEWRIAEDRFRAALKVDPTLTEARIRLGHALERRERPDEAVTELERALAEGPAGVMKYYALIFLGRAQQSLDRLDAARRAFEQASTLYPDAQSPRLGLSEIARDMGDRPSALDALGPIVATEAPVDRHDPYWAYAETHVPDVDALLADLRRATAELRAAAARGAGAPRPRVIGEGAGPR